MINRSSSSPYTIFYRKHHPIKFAVATKRFKLYCAYCYDQLYLNLFINCTPADGYMLGTVQYMTMANIFSLKLTIIFALSMLTSLSYSYHSSLLARRCISPVYQPDHLQNRKQLRLSSSNVYLSDGLPLINDISVININTNQDVNFLSYIKDITSSDSKKLIILGNHHAISAITTTTTTNITTATETTTITTTATDTTINIYPI